MDIFPETVILKSNLEEYGCDAIIASFPCRPDVNKQDTIDNVKLYDKINLSKKITNQHLLISESDGMQYTGFDFGDKAPLSNMFTKYMVGIFNKKRNKLQVLNTSYFIMNPYFQNSKDAVNQEISAESRVNQNQVKDLVKAFGTSKSKRAIDARDKNKIDDGTLADTINSVVQNTSVTENPTVDESVGEYMPICNEKATDVKDIYPIENIISANEMDSLKSFISEFTSCTPKMIEEWKNSNKYPIYILNHLRNLPFDEEMKIKRIKELLYLHYMLLVYKMNNYQLRKKVELAKLDIPKMIKSNLLNKFTHKVIGNQSQHTMPSHLRDSLLLNILIVCLNIDSFVSDVKTLNMTIANGKDIGKYLRQLGCKVDDKATLSIPFVKPTYIKRPSKRTRTAI